jgi:hypothetical protein
MLPAGLEPTIPAIELPLSHASHRADHCKRLPLYTNIVSLVTIAPIFEVLQPSQLPRARHVFHGMRSSRFEHFAELNSFQGHFRSN